MKTQFICEKCGEAYDTAEDAKKCEANHGVLIEVHPMPGASYHHGFVYPELIYARFCNEKGDEVAAEYRFLNSKNTDFSIVKKERGCLE